MEVCLRAHHDALSKAIVIFSGGIEKQAPKLSFRAHELVIIVKQTRGRGSQYPASRCCKIPNSRSWRKYQLSVAVVARLNVA